MPTSRADQLAAFLSKGYDRGADAFRDASNQSAQMDIEGQRARQMEAWRQAQLEEREKDRKLRESEGAENRALRKATQQSLDHARDERKDERLVQVIDKSGLPETLPALIGAKQYEGKSHIPGINLLPNSMQGLAANIKGGLGEMFGVEKWKGSGEEFQKMQRLLNMDIRQLSGTAVTAYEEGRKMVEAGMKGGSAAQVKLGIEMMEDSARSNAQNIVAGFGQEAVDRYERQGGLALRDLIKGQSKAPAKAGAKPQMSFDEYKKRKAAGKL